MEKSNETPPVIDTLFLNVNKKLKSYDKLLNTTFGQLHTNFDRFKLVWSIPIMHTPGFFETVFDSQAFYDAKDVARSVAERRAGNEAFRLKDFPTALLNYNLSIRYAEPCADTPLAHKEQQEVDNELALAYANRSAVFFHLEEFGLSLSDIEQAIRHGYPARLRPRLIERKFNCLFNMEQYEELMRCVGSETRDLEVIAMFANRVAKQKNGFFYDKK
jgi:tetratricopeptide (TPR) repeat protein